MHTYIYFISKGQSQTGAATNNNGPFPQTVLNVTEIKDVCIVYILKIRVKLLIKYISS